MKMDKPADASDILPFLISEVRRICSLEVTPDTALLSDGLLDSMGLVELIASVQSAFGVQLELSVVRRETFDTPRMMAAEFAKRG